jgi:quinol-cytochrome oxidoreductase complex cytochrome b subunit
MLKKYVLFVGSFCIGYVVLEILSGLLLTMFYTPSMSLKNSAVLPSQVEFGSTNFFPSLIISLLALAIAFGTTKLFKKVVS